MLAVFSCRVKEKHFPLWKPCESVRLIGWCWWRKGKMETLGLREWSWSAFLADYSYETMSNFGKSLRILTHGLRQRRRNSFCGRGKKKKLTPGSKGRKKWPLKFGKCKGSCKYDPWTLMWMSASLGWSLSVICSKSLTLWASGNQFISQVPSASKITCCFFSL